MQKLEGLIEKLKLKRDENINIIEQAERVLDRILDIQEKTEQAILNNTRNIASMALQDAERNMAYVPKNETKALGWEGYQ